MKNYENLTKILTKVRKVRDAIFKYRYAIIGVTVLTVATTSTLCGITGVVTNKGQVAKTYEYGEKIDIKPNAIMSDCYIEYAKNGTNEWTKEVPTKVGTYNTRVVSKNVAKKDKISKYATFDIVPKKVIVSVERGTGYFKYGDLPMIINEELAYGDELKAGVVCLEDYTKLETNAYVDTKSIHINNRTGEDVSNCYTFETKKVPINIVKRPIAVNLTGGDTIYTGEKFDTTQTEVTSGSLAFTDKIKTHDDSVAVNPGDYISSVDRNKEITILNKDNVDVTNLYDIRSSADDINIQKIPLKIKSASLERTYDGKSPDVNLINKFEVEGLLANHEVKATFPDRTNLPDYIYPTDDNQVVVNDFSYEIVEKDHPEKIVTHFYDLPVSTSTWGTIQTHPKELIVETESKTITYDGNSYQSKEPSKIDGLVPGDKFVVEQTTNVEEATGPVKNLISSYEIVNGNNEIVTRGYDVKFKNGDLSVLKRNVDIDIKSIQENPTTKYYDGEELNLKTDNLSFDEGSIAASETLMLDEENTEKGLTKPLFDKKGNVLSKKVKYQAKVLDKRGNDVSKNYNFNYLSSNEKEPEYGLTDLRVNKRNVEVTINDGVNKEYQYSGKNFASEILEEGKYRVTNASGNVSDGTGLAQNEKITLTAKQGAEAIEAGTYNVANTDFVDCQITNNEGTIDTTECYNVQYKEGNVKIDALEIELGTLLTKEYDDKGVETFKKENIEIKNVNYYHPSSQDEKPTKPLNEANVDKFKGQYTLSYDLSSTDPTIKNATEGTSYHPITLSNLKVMEGSFDRTENFKIKITNAESKPEFLKTGEGSVNENIFKLKVDKKHVALKPNAIDCYYEGQLINNQIQKATVSNNGLVKDHKLHSYTVGFNGEDIPTPGIYKGSSYLENVIIHDKFGNDVTKNYKIDCDTGLVNIKRKEITIVTRGETKDYDGENFKEINFQGFEATPTLYEGHKFDFTRMFEHTPLLLGSGCRNNTFNTLRLHEVYNNELDNNNNVIAITDKETNLIYDLNDYYKITVVNSLLQINKRLIKLSGYNKLTTYNGHEQKIEIPYDLEISKNSKYIHISEGDLPDGIKMTTKKSDPLSKDSAIIISGKNANNFDEYGKPTDMYKIKDIFDYISLTKDGEDVSTNFILQQDEIGLTISKATANLSYFNNMTISKDDFSMPPQEITPVQSSACILVGLDELQNVKARYIESPEENVYTYIIEKSNIKILNGFENVTNQYVINGFGTEVIGGTTYYDVIKITVTVTD